MDITKIEIDIIIDDKGNPVISRELFILLGSMISTST